MARQTHQMSTPNTSEVWVSRPEMTSSVSPGSRNPTSRPVSAKTIAHTTTRAQGPAPAMMFSGSSQGMRAVCMRRSLLGRGGVSLSIGLDAIGALETPGADARDDGGGDEEAGDHVGDGLHSGDRCGVVPDHRDT